MLHPSLVLSITLLAGSALQAQAPEQAPTATTPGGYVRPEPPGRRIDVGGGRRLHLRSLGESQGPTVVFEAGLSQYAANTTFSIVQAALAPHARVVTYDRAGMGWSDPAPEGWTMDGMAADLHELLKAAGEPGPYVLVAHSFGGLVARNFIRLYPDKVVGLVLLDATSDEDFPELLAARTTVVRELDAAIAASTPGVPVIGMPIGTAPEVVMAFTPECLRGVKAEFETLDRLPAERKCPGGFGELGDLPLLVVRRGKGAQPPSADDRRHQLVQENLAGLSTNSALVVAEKSGHTIPLDEPALVADVVRRMLDALRTGKRLEP